MCLSLKASAPGGPPEQSKQEEAAYTSRLFKLEPDQLRGVHLACIWGPCLRRAAACPGRARSGPDTSRRVPGRNNVTSNLKLAVGVTLLLAGLTYGFLASNGLV